MPLKARVRYSGALEDVIRFGDIHNFVTDRGWWVEEFNKGRMWFPGAVVTCYSEGGIGFDHMHVELDDYVTRDAEDRLYVWHPRQFHEIYELVDCP